MINNMVGEKIKIELFEENELLSKKDQIEIVISEISGNNDKIYSAMIDEDYNPHAFLHIVVNNATITQKLTLTI